MASDLPSLEYAWPREEAGATATLTDISSSPNTLPDFNFSFFGMEDIPGAPQNSHFVPSQQYSSESSKQSTDVPNNCIEDLAYELEEDHVRDLVPFVSQSSRESSLGMQTFGVLESNNKEYGHISDSTFESAGTGCFGYIAGSSFEVPKSANDGVFLSLTVPPSSFTSSPEHISQQQQRPQTQMLVPAELISKSRSIFTPVDGSQSHLRQYGSGPACASVDLMRLGEQRTIQESPPLEQKKVEREMLRTSRCGGPPHIKKAVIPIEDLTILLRDSNLILTEPMEQVYGSNDEPSLVDIILLDDAKSKDLPISPEALRKVLGTPCSKARVICSVCNIESENNSSKTSPDQPCPNKMPLTSQTSLAKYRVYGQAKTPSFRYSYLEYIKLISDHISPVPDPNVERLVTIIYRSMVTGTVVKRARVALLEPSELSPFPASYSLRWLDPSWRTIESMISDHTTTNPIPCSLVDSHPIGPLGIQRQVPHTCVLMPSVSCAPYKYGRRDCQVIHEQSVQIDKATVHARRRNRFRIITVFKMPVDAVKDLASFL
jgi:hypothetical protein